MTETPSNPDDGPCTCAGCGAQGPPEQFEVVTRKGRARAWCKDPAGCDARRREREAGKEGAA